MTAGALCACLFWPAAQQCRCLYTMNAAFIALTFILLIIIIFLARDMTEAMLIISLLANLLVISGQFGLLSKGLVDITMQDAAAQAASTPDSAAQAPAAGVPDGATDGSSAHPNGDMYGSFYDQWNAYKDTYNSAYDSPRMAVSTGAEQSYTVDEHNTLIAQQRARDRKCSDGWLTKDKYYYQYHYGSELDDAEAKAWWGRNEY